MATEVTVRNGGRVPTPPVPLPHPSTRIPKHLHDSIPEDPTRFLQPSADVHSARPHPGVDALLKTKGKVQFERTVDSLSQLFSACYLGSFLQFANRSCGSPFFQRSLCRLHPEVLQDYS